MADYTHFVIKSLSYCNGPENLFLEELLVAVTLTIKYGFASPRQNLYKRVTFNL